MDFDEIDDFVDALFEASDPVNRVINETYEEIQRWHNGRISEGTDPESGLHGLPHIPWDEGLDGVAAMMGACVPEESSLERNGGDHDAGGVAASTQAEGKRGQGLLVIAGLLMVLVFLLCVWMPFIAR